MTKKRKYTIDPPRVLSVAETRANFTHLSNCVAYGGERLIVERYHKPVMALISIEDLELLEALENEQDLVTAKKRLKSLSKAGSTSLEAFKK